MNKAIYSSSQHLIVRLLISLWVLTAVVQTASAANSTLLNQPGQFSGVAKPRASSASETAGRRILARFKTNSSFAGAAAIAVGMQRLLVDKNDRKMPIKGISHLKTLHLSHKKAAAATNTLPEKQLKLQALPVSDDFQLSVLEITDPEADRDVLIKALIATGEVEYAEADVVMSANLMPDDSDFSSLWGLHNTGQSGGTVDADIDAVEAWDITTGSASVVVAVIDTGVRYDHPDLTGNMWRNPGETGLDADGMDKAGNGVDDDFNGYVDDVYGIDCINDDSDPIDDDASSYHGTHVAGIIGARGNNASQVTGVNWNVSIMALKYLGANGRGVVSDAVECLTYAANMKKNHGVNLRVTNNSYGGGNATQSMRDAILATQNQDILFVAAAGNDGEDNDAIPHYPSSYDLPSVVAVASTNRYDTKAETSNYGLVSVDIGAPGVSILSTVGSNNLNTLSGTSMASPQVAGVAALLLAYDPSMTYSQLKARMLDTANPIAALDGLTATGGRLNAFDALNCSAGNINMYFNPVSATQYLKLGQAVTVQVRLTSCGDPVTGSTVTAEPDNGQAAFVLADDGIAPDETAADGFYTANWTPTVNGELTLAIAAVSEGANNNEVIAFTVVDVPDYAIDPAYPYAWKESSDGNDIGLANVDDEGANIPIGFDFNFYGLSYSDVWVHSNGMLKFESDVELSFFEFIDSPATTVPNNFISPLWEDLDPSANNGAIYSKLEGLAPNRRLIVQWHNLLHYRQVSENLPGTVTFQAILYEASNDIVLQYQDLTFGSEELDFAARALIGIERFDGDQGLVFLNQGLPATTGLSDHQAIVFSQVGSLLRTLTVTPAPNGSVMADSGQINCSNAGGPCFGQFALNTDVELTATPANGYRFESWLGAGCDAVVINTCTVTMENHKTIKASFGIAPAIIVTPTSGLVTAEIGSIATFTVALNLSTTADVSIALSTSDASEGSVSPATLVFTAFDGIQAKTVTVSGVNDVIDDGDVAYQVVTAPAVSDDLNFDQLDASDVSLSNLDDSDTAGITITPTNGLTTSEAGASDIFSVVLDTEPVEPVVVNLLSSDSTEGKLDKAWLTFDAASWNQPQLVSLTGENDEHDDGDIAYLVQLAVSNDSDSAYRLLSIPSLAAQNINDDFAGVSLTVGNTDTSEAGGETTFTIELEASPQSPVSIALSSNDITEGVVSPAVVLFDSENWNLAQTVTVTGVEDYIDDGDVSYAVVTAAAVSGGSDYAGLNTDDIFLLNIDDDTAGIIINAVQPLETDESGITTSFTVVLNSDPISDVDIGIAVNDISEASVSSGLLRFTALNARIAQTVTVTGLDDDLVDGDIVFRVVISAAMSADNNYSGVDPVDLSGVNRDLDTDGDNDSIVDGVDNCIALPNANQIDSDFDLLGDVCDPDDDNDSELDENDNCPLDDNSAQKDTDFDGLGDACDPDSDNDFVLDGGDANPLDPRICEDADTDGCDDCSDGFGADPHNDGPDLDGDFICDLGDEDLDGDEILNAQDNCPLVTNFSQIDLDRDGIGDLCDETVIISVDESICWPINTSDNSVMLICL